MTAVAIGNFSSVDRILDNPAPGAQEYLKILGDDSARMLLRHLASEQNREYFSNWELVQLGLACGLTITLFLGTSANRGILIICGLLLVFVIIQHWLLTPQMVASGAVVDFVPPDAISPERVRFWRLHNAYSAFEVIKIALAIGLSARLLVYRSASRSRRKIRDEVNSINHANYGRVNR